MKDEIKEIRDYIACPQLGDDYYGKWGALRLDQRLKIKSLLDYITNLQEENERLKSKIDEIVNKQQFIEEKFDYKSRINKAIEYIQNSLILTDGFNIYEDGAKELLNILQGSDK